ncbi:MAG: hypothetical protein AB2L24_22830 [Mangrovibacterium sp.]
MKYSDIISLQGLFPPCFHLGARRNGLLEAVCSTTQFNALLEKTLDAVSSSISSNRKSIWVQGTFGTGKSHAKSVIRHLLCDELSEINDYISNRIENPNLKNRLIALRNNKCFFSVILSGVEGAYNPHSFALTLERTIKETLRKAGHQINVYSDFERAIELIEKNEVLDFEKIISNSPKLQIIAKTKDAIVQKLKSADIELYLVLEETLQKYSVQLSSGDITRWLSEVETEIRNTGIADGLLIFWDEFTSVMDTISSGLINVLQKIAELSEKQSIYLYLISHRVPMAAGDKGRDITKMNDRFHIIQYKMEAITTYHIMAATLKKVEKTYNLLRNEKMFGFNKLITYLVDNDSQQSKEDIQNLFPLHPYTAFLCSSLADHIGSANRSVFNFMYDSKNGFLHFLSDENACTENRLMTADYLWDFFLETFLADPIKYGMVTETFHTHIRKVEENGLPYTKVFKGILLLNAMRNTFEKEQVLPSAKNIKFLFRNEDFEGKLDVILDYFGKNEIVHHDPSDNFLIEFSSLPINEINEEKKRAEAHYKDALTILEFDPTHKQNITKHFDDTLIRVGRYCFLASVEEYFVKSRLDSTFKNETYSIRIALFFAMDEQERQSMLDLVNRLSRDIFRNVIFIIFNEVLDNDAQQKLKFIQYVSNQQVAVRRNSPEQAQTNLKNANLIITTWVNRLLKQGNCILIFNGNENIGTTNTVAQYINQNISFKIFNCGIEIMPSMRQKPMTFYRQQNSQKSAEVMLCAIDRDDAEKKFSNGQYTPAKFLFKDENDNYIVEQNLNLKSDAIDTHPLVFVQKKVDELLRKAKQQNTATFNLGQVLYPLTEAPFGLYSNIPNVALLAFALRKYQNELYNAEVGIPVTSDNLRDKVVDLFNFWQNGRNESKLRVRFGSKEEKDLKDDLVKIFDLQNVPEVGELTSIKNVRWGIAYYCKHKSKYPLWSLKYSDNSSEALSYVIDQIADMVQKEDTTAEQIKKIHKEIQDQRFDLQKLLLSQNAFEEGFKKFINDVESVNINDSWWKELLAYLTQRMQKEIGWWKESDVESKVKDFYIKKMTPAPQPQLDKQPILHTNDGSISEPPIKNIKPNYIEKAKNVVTKVSQANLQSVQLKLILIEVLNNFPETADIINDNLG